MYCSTLYVRTVNFPNRPFSCGTRGVGALLRGGTFHYSFDPKLDRRCRSSLGVWNLCQVFHWDTECDRSVTTTGRVGIRSPDAKCQWIRIFRWNKFPRRMWRKLNYRRSSIRRGKYSWRPHSTVYSTWQQRQMEMLFWNFRQINIFVCIYTLVDDRYYDVLEQLIVRYEWLNVCGRLDDGT